MRRTGESRLAGWLRAIGLGDPACVGYRFSGTFRAEGPGRGWFHLVREDEWSDEDDRDVRLVHDLLRWHSGPTRDPAALRTCFDDLFPTALGAVHRVWDRVCDRLPESGVSGLAGAVARSVLDRIAVEDAFLVDALVRREPGFSEMATALPNADGERIVFQELHRRPGDARLLRVASTAYAESRRWDAVTMLVALHGTVEDVERTIPWVPAEFRELAGTLLQERETRETSPDVRERLRRASPGRPSQTHFR